MAGYTPLLLLHFHCLLSFLIHLLSAFVSFLFPDVITPSRSLFSFPFPLSKLLFPFSFFPFLSLPLMLLLFCLRLLPSSFFSFLFLRRYYSFVFLLPFSFISFLSSLSLFHLPSDWTPVKILLKYILRKCNRKGTPNFLLMVKNQRGSPLTMLSQVNRSWIKFSNG